MYRTTGLYIPTHRPLPLSQVEHARSVADKMPAQPSQTEPMVFVRLFLVVGMVIAAAFVAAALS